MRKTLSLLLTLSVFLSPTLQAANCNYKAMLRSEKDRGWYDADCLQGLAEYVRAHKKDLSQEELLVANTMSLSIWQEMSRRLRTAIDSQGVTKDSVDTAFQKWGDVKQAACLLYADLNPSKSVKVRTRGYNKYSGEVVEVTKELRGARMCQFPFDPINERGTGSNAAAPSKEEMAKAEKRYGIRVEEPKRADLLFPQLPDMTIAPPMEKGLELFAQMLRDLYNKKDSTGEQFEGLLDVLSKDISFTPGERNYVPPSLVRLALMYYAEKLPADRQSAAKLAKYAKGEKGTFDGFRYWAGVTAAAYAKSQNPQDPIPGKFDYSTADRIAIWSGLHAVDLEDSASDNYKKWLSNLYSRITTKKELEFAQDVSQVSARDASAPADVNTFVAGAVPILTETFDIYAMQREVMLNNVRKILAENVAKQAAASAASEGVVAGGVVSVLGAATVIWTAVIVELGDAFEQSYRLRYLNKMKELLRQAGQELREEEEPVATIQWNSSAMEKIGLESTPSNSPAPEQQDKRDKKRRVTCAYAFYQNTETLKLRHLGKFLNPGDEPTGARARALHQCLENAGYCQKAEITTMKDLFSNCSDVQVKVVPVCTEDLVPLQEAWNVKKSFINSYFRQQRLYVRAVYHKNKWMPEAEDGIIGKVEEILETNLLGKIRDKCGKFLEGIIPLNKDGSMWYRYGAHEKSHNHFHLERIKYYPDNNPTKPYVCNVSISPK